MSETGRLVKHIAARHFNPGSWSSRYSTWISRARKGIPPAWHKFMLALKTFPWEKPQNESKMLATKDWQLIDVSGDASSKIRREKLCFANGIRELMYLRMRRLRVFISSECLKNELRILLGYCIIVFSTLRQISIIFGSVVGDNARFNRISSVANLSRSWTFDSVPFASEPMMIATFSRRCRGLLSLCNKDIKRGTNPCSIMKRFCLFEPMIRFLIFVVASKHSTSSSENKLSKYARKLSTSYKTEKHLSDLLFMWFSHSDWKSADFPPRDSGRLCYQCEW